MDLLLEWKEGDTAGANEAAATVGAEMLTQPDPGGDGLGNSLISNSFGLL